MMNPILDTQIALEINIPETLFRRLQQVLDQQTTQSIDDLTCQALSTYLPQLLTKNPSADLQSAKRGA
jgi:hypothetical protein